MRRLTSIFLIVLSISLLSMVAADACGDKLLRIGRGARFQRSMHPAVVLIYIPSTAPADVSTQAPRLQSFLKKAGHKANVVQGTSGLGLALSSSKYDVVLTDLGQVADVQREIDGSASKPVVVPMIFSGTKSEVAAAKKHYRCVVKNHNNGDEYLDAIDEAMRSRTRS